MCWSIQKYLAQRLEYKKSNTTIVRTPTYLLDIKNQNQKTTLKVLACHAKYELSMVFSSQSSLVIITGNII